MSDYTPSTDEVRDQYASVSFNGIPAHARAEFDRWLESVEAAAEQRGAKAERERIARNIEAEEPKIRGYVDFDRHKEDCIGQINGLRRAARVAREGA